MIELDTYLFLTILEAITILGLLAGFLYFRVKKYKPFFEAKKHPDSFLKKYLEETIGKTKKYAASLESAAEKGDTDAKEHRQSMVARLNWLELEKEFVNRKKIKSSFWIKLNTRINKLLNRWQSNGIITALPDEATINNILAEDETDSSDSRSSSDPQDEASYANQKNTITFDEGDSKQLKKRIKELEKQVRNLSSYKALFFGLQNTYNAMVKSYKELKKSLFELNLNTDESEKLKEILNTHDDKQNELESKMKNLEGDKERLKEELEQLEAAYMLQQQEQLAKAQEQTENKEEIELVNIQEMIDNQDLVIRELKATLHALPLDTETKLAIDETTAEFERNHREIGTCVQMLEMERERLLEEVNGLQEQPAPNESAA